MAFRPSLPPFILESAALRSQSAWTLMAQALLTGLVSGGVIGLFRWLYTIINGAVRAHMAGQDPFAPATLALMAAGLLLMALTAGLPLRYEPLIGGSGIPQVELIAAGKLPPMRWARVLWCKFVATLAALSAGLSVGREGPCIMMGATVGAGVGYMWHDRCRANRPRYLVGGGVAGMTAAFGAPVAGMFFAFEEMKTPLTLPMLLFTSLSALSAWFMVDVVLGMAGLFSASVRTPLTGAALVMEMCGGFHLAPAVLLAAFAAAFTANALHSTPVYDSLKERILDQRRRRRAAASPTEERS